MRFTPGRHRPNGDFHPERDYWQKLCAPRAGMLHVPGIPHCRRAASGQLICGSRYLRDITLEEHWLWDEQ